MTEKRFTLKGLIEAVPNVCDNGEIMEQEDVVDLLNEQEYTIQRLTEELEECKAVIDNRWKEYLRKKFDSDVE